MKTFILRTYLCVTVAAFAAFFTPTTSPADEIPVTGLQANGHGVANWNVTNNVVGVEPFRVGHHLTWLEQAVFQATGQNTNFVALYYLAWRGHDGITPGSDSALQMGLPLPADFPNLKAALMAGGFNFGDIKTEFGTMDLKTDQSGVEWNYNAGTQTETRVYSGGSLSFKLNGHDLIGAAMPNFHFTIRFNNLLDFNDDQISGLTDFAFPTNRSGGAPVEVQAVAQAFLQDIANRGIRLVFDSLQPEVQNEFVHRDARVGGFFEAQTGRIETGVGVFFGNDGFNAAEIAQSPNFIVQLTQTNDVPVMVDYHTVNGTAIAGEDYAATSGTLTFQPGQTSLNIPVGILPDNHFENIENFHIVLSNPVNAQIVERNGGGEAQGEIVDNDLPAFPVGVPEPPVPVGICTPLVGNYNQTLPTRNQLWIAQANGGDVNVRVFAVAVNTNDNGGVGVAVRTTNHVSLGNSAVNYTVGEVSAAGLPFERMVEIPVGVRADGDVLRIEISMHPGDIPFTQRHYRIEATGVRWLALGSPSFAGFEADPAIWHFRVGNGEDLVLDLFTNGVPAGATSAEITLIDPMGNLHSSSTVPVNAGPEVNVAGAAPGLWSMRLQANDHYRLAKLSGANRSIFANWRTGAQGDLIGRVDLDGAPAFGAHFNVDLFQREVFGGMPTNILLETKLVTNAFFGFHPLLPAEYVVSVRPVSMNHSMPAMTTNWVFCDPAITNVYASMTIGGGQQKDFISIRGVHGENEGSVAWNASAGSPEGGPSPTHQQPDGGISYYWFASPDYDNIVPGSMGGGHGEAPVQGFPNTIAALQSHGRTVGELFIRFGPANLGAHQLGVDYTINGSIETRKYQAAPGSSYRIFLGNEMILTAPMPDVNMTLDFGNIGTPNDDVISGITAGFTPVDASGGSSPAAQAVAAALLQDVGGGQLRSVFEGIQPITQTGLNANGRTGAYFSAPMGRLELCPDPNQGGGNGPPPVLTLLPGVVVEADAGQTNLLHFGVKLSHPSASPVTVDFTTHDAVAADGSDFIDVMTTVTLDPGMTMTNVAVPVIGDNVEEQLHERMNATLANAQNAVIGGFFANGVIVDNDGTNQSAPVTFVVADGVVYEGDSGSTQVDLQVTLTRTNNLEVRVDYSTRDNSATAPSDYTVSMGTLVFPPGSAVQTVSVPVHGDRDPEQDEFFWLDLSNPVNAVIDPNADIIGAGRILNDDQGQGGGPGLFAHNAMVRESDVTNVFLDFRVALFPASTNTVMVDYSTADWTAMGGVDYQPANGTLTFAPGETNKTVSVTVLPDAVFEPTELLYFNLSNGANAMVGLPQGVGVIKDNDHPDFPIDQPLPDPLPCICTPVVGNYNSNAIHSWSTKAHGGPLDLVFSLHSVNTNEIGHQAVRVYDAGGVLIASTNVLMDLAEVATPEYMESVMLALGSRTPGEILRIDVELLAGPLNAHYSLKLCGARWVGTASPSFSAWEEEPTRYRFVVQGGEDLDLDIFTNGITPDVAMQVPLRLFDPTGAQVPLPGYPTTVNVGNEVHVSGAMPGIWTLEANVTNRIMGHYRLAKTSGVNRGIFFDWASGGNGVIHTKFTVNGNPPTPGTLFTLNSFRHTTAGLEPFVSGVFTNNYVFDFDPYEMLPGTYVFEAVPGGTNLGPAIWMTNLVTCMGRQTNCFDFMGPGGTNQPPGGPALYARNAILREGTVTNRTMYFAVNLWPPAITPVTVDFSLAPVTATVGVDYQDTNGTLTFPPGMTNQWVPVTILSDAVFEGPEFFHLNLNNAMNAAIADPQADGIILDDDHPDYPGDNDDLLPFPAQLPCVCTPRVGHADDTNTLHTWVVRAHGGAMSLRLFGVAVNTNDPSTIEATVYGPSGSVIANPSVSYSAGEAAAGGVGYEKWVDVPLGTFPAGAKLRVEVTVGAGTPSTQTHYRLKFAGARWIATSSPSFNSLEHDPSLWRLRVLPGDSHLNIDFFTTDTPVPATAMEYELYDPNGVLVSASNSLPIITGDELSIANPTPGLWALRCETVMDHYRLAKSGGIDNTLYLGWRGAAYGEMMGQIKVDGTNAVGVPFDVSLAYQFRVNGVLTNVPVGSEMTTNGMFHFNAMQHGFYVVTATPQVGGITAPPAQTNVVTCDLHPSLMFQAFGVGGGSPVVFAPDRMFLEADTNKTGFFDIFLSGVSGSDVTVDFSTGGGTATAGQDYLSANGTVTIPAGQTNATVGVVIVGDNAFELNKTFLLNLSNPSGATLSMNSATGTIINDDRPIAARFHRIRRLQNGGPFKLEFDLGDNGAVYEIQATENLIQWAPIGQVTGASGMFEFTDNDSTNRVRRYYRAIAP